MSIPAKTAITDLTTANDVDYPDANQPHTDVETNIDDIILYLNSFPFRFLAADEDNFSGLDFAYTAGSIRYNNTIVDISANTITLTASSTNYVEVDSAGTVTTNTTNFTAGRIPLWKVTTNTTDITSWSDSKSWNKLVSIYGNDFTINGNLSSIGSSNITGNNSGALYVNALTGSVYIANESGNGQAIIRDGSGGTTKQITLNGSAGSIYIGSNVVWHSGNDGPGSGLDASLLDGLNSTQFIRTNAATTATGTYTSNRTNTSINISGKNYSGTDKLSITSTADPDMVFLANVGGTDRTSSVLRFDSTDDTWKIGTEMVWHSGNDGAGSGLDADTIDGNDGSYYQGVKVNAADPAAGYLDAKIKSNSLNVTINGSGPYTLKIKPKAFTYITKALIQSGNNNSWQTKSLTSIVPAGTKGVILEVESVSGGDGGTGVSIYGRKASGSPEHLLLNQYNSYPGSKNRYAKSRATSQWFLPITTTRTIDIRIDNNITWGSSWVYVIGYF